MPATATVLPTHTRTRDVDPPRIRFSREHRWSPDGRTIARLADGLTITPRSWAAGTR